MAEIIVKMKDDHIKVKGGEYVADLVRCGECKNADELCPYCHKHDIHVTAYFYCADGERKEQ